MVGHTSLSDLLCNGLGFDVVIVGLGLWFQYRQSNTDNNATGTRKQRKASCDTGIPSYPKGTVMTIQTEDKTPAVSTLYPDFISGCLFGGMTDVMISS